MPFIEPMLADKLPDGKALEDYIGVDGWVAEVKIDGHRIGIEVQDHQANAWSRLANARQLPAHILNEVTWLTDSYVDGELYVPGKHSTDVTAGINADEQKLVLFDVLAVLGSSITHLPQNTRREYLMALTENLNSDVVTVSEQFAPSRERYRSIVDAGGEGIMLKSLDARYRPGARTQSWLKVKRMVEANLPIIGFKEGTTRGVLSVVELRLPNGKATTVKARTNKDATAFTANPMSFIGATMEVEAQEWTTDGALRHPRMVRLAGPHE